MKGGDPSARSRTGTLCQLNPSYQVQVCDPPQRGTHPPLTRVVRWAVCARNRDVFIAPC